MTVAVVHARIPVEHEERLRAHAAANDRTLSQEVRRMVRMYVAMLERDGRTPVQPAARGSAEIALEPIPDT